MKKLFLAFLINLIMFGSVHAVEKWITTENNEPSFDYKKCDIF